MVYNKVGLQYTFSIEFYLNIHRWNEHYVLQRTYEFYVAVLILVRVTSHLEMVEVQLF